MAIMLFNSKLYMSDILPDHKTALCCKPVQVALKFKLNVHILTQKILTDLLLCINNGPQ